MNHRRTLNPAQIDAAWMTQVLTESGALRRARITEMTVVPVGVGMIGESLRFTMSYDVPNAGPRSVVGKFASPDAKSRETGRAFDLYRAEVRFYQEIAASVAVTAPRCHFADIVDSADEFAIILEDLTPAKAGNQLDGCTLAEARLAMCEAAALHGPRWNDATLHQLPYLADRRKGLDLVRSIFPDCLAEFHRRYDGILEPEYMAVCDRYGQFIGDFFNTQFSPFTLTHYDFRLDNMLFDAGDPCRPLVVLDWQSISISTGALDVAYFLGLALPIETRRRHERELLDLYRDELRKYGVTDYSFDALYRDYRITVLQGVSTAVFASAGTKRTERGDAMFLAMARGACAQAIDAETFMALAG